MNKCRMCKGEKFQDVIDFGDCPLVNSLIEEEDLDKKEETYPLMVEQCKDCHLVQIVTPVSSQKIYKDQDYLYYSGEMPQLSEYFREYAEDIKERFVKKGDLVIEIGSNDGIMLEHFYDKAVGLGIDPASNVVVRALKRGIPTISDFFTYRLARSIRLEFGYAQVIYGNNCIAHLNNLRDLMNGVKHLLLPEGVFIVECNYWGAMVKNKNYSLIYHDHFSYFTLKNWVDFLKKNYDMEVFDAIVTEAQGGSLRLFAGHKGRHPKTDRYNDLLLSEIEYDLNSSETCDKYKKDVEREAKKLGELIRKLKKEGKSIAGYGAAAKGFSILKLADIDQRHIDFFVDDSPAKQDKFTPISHIKVISRKSVDTLPDYFFITAPNYADIIIEKEKNFQERGGKFILADSTIV